MWKAVARPDSRSFRSASVALSSCRASPFVPFTTVLIGYQIRCPERSALAASRRLDSGTARPYADNRHLCDRCHARRYVVSGLAPRDAVDIVGDRTDGPDADLVDEVGRCAVSLLGGAAVYTDVIVTRVSGGPDPQ
jgi:hypothetical protein